MKRKIHLSVFVLFILFLLANFEQVTACWCRGVSSCEATNRANVIFVGKVEKIVVNETPEVDENFEGSKTVFFQIKENFGGAEGKTIQIKTGMYSGDCEGFPFEQANDYLVYAYKDDKNELRTGLCGGTKTIDKAAKDFEFLRALPNGNQNGQIFGWVHGFTFVPSLDKYDSVFLPGIFLRLTGNGINKTISTDAAGDYKFSGLKAGKYRLKVFMPDYYDTFEDGKDNSVREIELNGRGCQRETFIPVIKNSVEGTVRDKDGKPIENVSVWLIAETTPAEDDPPRDDVKTTEKDGKFRFYNIKPGRYYLGVNIGDEDETLPKIFYPNTVKRAEALKLDFGLGKILTGYDLVWEAGK